MLFRHFVDPENRSLMDDRFAFAVAFALESFVLTGDRAKCTWSFTTYPNKPLLRRAVTRPPGTRPAAFDQIKEAFATLQGVPLLRGSTILIGCAHRGGWQPTIHTTGLFNFGVERLRDRVRSEKKWWWQRFALMLDPAFTKPPPDAWAENPRVEALCSALHPIGSSILHRVEEDDTVSTVMKAQGIAKADRKTWTMVGDAATRRLADRRSDERIFQSGGFTIVQME